MKRTIYFDNAATTFPKPRSVTDATVRTVTKFCANPGRSSHSLALRASEEVYECRHRLSQLFGCPDENAVFTLNATYAINLALKSVLRRGDHVLISDVEHNAVLRPVSALAQRGLISYGIYRASADPDEICKEITERITPKTALVCACHRSNVCNLLIPCGAVGELCRRHGLYFILDASQSAGTVPIDMERDRIDILCAPAHKGLYGIPGCGFALFGKDISADGVLSTFVEGGNGIASDSPFMPDLLPVRLEAGTLPLPAIAALSAGIDFVTAMTPERLRRHEEALCSLACKGLGGIRGIKLFTDQTGPTVLFSADGIPSEEMAAMLDGYGICVRAGLHCAPLAHKRLGTPKSGAVRLSFGAFNTDDEVKYFLYAVSRIMTERQKRRDR